MIEELESAAERMARWIAEHAWPVASALLLLLAIAAALGGYRAWSSSREEAASDALNRVRSAYLRALGTDAFALEEPELANPAAGAVIREQYLGEFRAVAEEHQGTVAGTLALFETADLLEKLGREEQSLEAWNAALDSASGNPALEGLLYQRIAATRETRGEWGEAAAAHEQAAALAGYPLRYWALADAARCYAAAGEPDRALALYERLEQEAPDLPLPPHLRQQRQELRAAAAG